MQSFVWFVSQCRIWTAKVSWAGKSRQSKYRPVKATQWEIGRTYLQARGTENNWSCLHFLFPQPPVGPRSPALTHRRKSMSMNTMMINLYSFNSIPPQTSWNYSSQTNSSVLVWRSRYLDSCPGRIPVFLARKPWKPALEPKLWTTEH